MRFLFVVAATLALSAPAESRPGSAAPSLSLDHVGIQATDLERSVAFYTQVLGLREVPAPFPRTAARWLALGGGRMLHIVGHGAASSSHNPWDHFALVCSDLDAMTTRLDALNVAWTEMDGKHSIHTRPDHVRQIFVRDPDGYTIEINDAK